MGGFAAIHLAFRHPDLFSKVGGHSPAIWVKPDRFMEAWLFPTPDLRKERDPLQLAQTQDLKGLEVYLDCGAEDALRFYEGSELLYKALQQRGVKSQYHLRPGPHGWVYWQQHFEEYLHFYAGK